MEETGLIRKEVFNTEAEQFDQPILSIQRLANIVVFGLFVFVAIMIWMPEYLTVESTFGIVVDMESTKCVKDPESVKSICYKLSAKKPLPTIIGALVQIQEFEVTPKVKPILKEFKVIEKTSEFTIVQANVQGFNEHKLKGVRHVSLVIGNQKISPAGLLLSSWQRMFESNTHRLSRREK